jgi:hypothetical protein
MSGQPEAVLPADLKPSDIPKLKYEEPKIITGEIYSASDPENLLFRFKRVATRSGQTLGVAREYSYPDGKPAAREHVVYQDNSLVLYELEELQSGGKGSAKVRRDSQNEDRGTIEFDYTKASDPSTRAKSHSEPLVPDVLVADMIGPFLRENCDRLARGEKVKCRYILVPRRETVGFVFVKESESTWHGHDVLILKMEPSSRIIAALVNPLFFTIEKQAPHRVLKYVGRTTPKMAAGNKWKDLDAVTVFDWK